MCQSHSPLTNCTPQKLQTHITKYHLTDLSLTEQDALWKNNVNELSSESMLLPD